MKEGLASLLLEGTIQRKSCQMFGFVYLLICKLLSVVAQSLKTIEVRNSSKGCMNQSRQTTS